MKKVIFTLSVFFGIYGVAIAAEDTLVSVDSSTVVEKTYNSMREDVLRAIEPDNLKISRFAASIGEKVVEDDSVELLDILLTPLDRVGIEGFADRFFIGYDPILNSISSGFSNVGIIFDDDKIGIADYIDLFVNKGDKLMEFSFYKHFSEADLEKILNIGKQKLDDLKEISWFLIALSNILKTETFKSFFSFKA